MKMNKERFFAEQAAIRRGWVIGQKKSSSFLRIIALTRFKINAKELHDKLTAKYVARHYID